MSAAVIFSAVVCSYVPCSEVMLRTVVFSTKVPQFFFSRVIFNFDHVFFVIFCHFVRTSSSHWVSATKKSFTVTVNWRVQSCAVLGCAVQWCVWQSCTVKCCSVQSWRRFQTISYQGCYRTELLPSLTIEWLESSTPNIGVDGLNPCYQVW